MAIVTPFKGVRYNPEKIPNIGDVVAPPYDVINSELQNSLYQLHPSNVIRLILGKQFPEDSEHNNRYTRASSFLKACLEEKVLLRESVPAIYIYSQTYTFNNKTKTRTGFICRFKLEEFGHGKIRPHENTLSKPKEDRLKLTKACKAQFSQIFSLYADKEKSTEALFQRVLETTPIVSFNDNDLVTHSLWQVTATDLIQAVTNQMKNREVLIADGHHRYETALNYMNYKRGSNPDHTGTEPYNYVMMYLTNCYSEGMSIFPTHRLVSNLAGFSAAAFLKEAKKLFHVKKVDLPPAGKERAQTLESAIETGEGAEKIIGAYLGNNTYVTLSLKNRELLPSIMRPGKSEALMGLDVSILHSGLIENIMGLTIESQREQKNITYTVNAGEAAGTVDEGAANVAFFLNATKIEEIQEVARAGEKMPQKSTFFYPKLKSGLVFNLVDS